MGRLPFPYPRPTTRNRYIDTRTMRTIRRSDMSDENINCDIMSQLIFFVPPQVPGHDAHGIPNPDGRHTEYQLFHYGTVDIFRHVPAFIDADACGAMPCRIRTERTTGHQPRLHGSARALSARTGPTCRTRAGPEPIRKDEHHNKKKEEKKEDQKQERKTQEKEQRQEEKKPTPTQETQQEQEHTTPPPNQNQNTRKNTMRVLHLAARKPP